MKNYFAAILCIIFLAMASGCTMIYGTAVDERNVRTISSDAKIKALLLIIIILPCSIIGLLLLCFVASLPFEFQSISVDKNGLVGEYKGWYEEKIKRMDVNAIIADPDIKQSALASSAVIFDNS